VDAVFFQRSVFGWDSTCIDATGEEHDLFIFLTLPLENHGLNIKSKLTINGNLFFKSASGEQE
jgi:hypothetical protein